MWRRLLTPRVSIRVLMIFIAFLAIGYGTIMILIEPYRRQWQAEQQAIAEIRHEAGRGFNFSTTRVGPPWLRRLAWGHEQYFDRVQDIFFTATSEDAYRARRGAFHHVRAVLQD